MSKNMKIITITLVRSVDESSKTLLNMMFEIVAKFAFNFLLVIGPLSNFLVTPLLFLRDCHPKPLSFHISGENVLKFHYKLVERSEK